MATTTKPARSRARATRNSATTPDTATAAAAALPLPEGDDGRRRVVLESVTPSVDGGRFPAKRVLGDTLDVEVDAFTDGHDEVAGVARVRAVGAAEWVEAPLVARGNDRWGASLPLTALGRHEFDVCAWIDRFGTWQHDLAKRVEAGQDVGVDLQIGAALVEAGIARAEARGLEVARTRELLATMTGADAGLASAAALTPELGTLMAAVPDRELETGLPAPLPVWVDRERARFSTWYERFPRSTGASEGDAGTLLTLADELPRIAAMGFDVLYLPPIHPIGRSHRKGPNNTVTAAEGDLGSPWAIGAAEGGHTEVHPDLGTLDDFDVLARKVQESGMELALDLAYQCAPDHPWVEQHPTWFRSRPDGTIQYAENPPKKYQDIYPIDFETEDWRELWAGLKSVVDFWVARGVRVFRVDNPHTKAFAFWEWLIGSVQAEHPDVLFLSEAFTRPRVMHRLAKAGFSQSYTYFTWRETGEELREYAEEVAHGPGAQYMRPNFWPNTPDILPRHLQLRPDGSAPVGTFVSRLVLAATLAASYGMYGPAFELLEGEVIRPGAEEYVWSEKFEAKWRDLGAEHSLAPTITALNRARHAHPSLQRNDTLSFLPCSNDQLLAYAKVTPGGGDAVLVVTSVDARELQVGTIEVPLHELGLSADRPFEVRDVLSGETFTWQGGTAYVELDAGPQASRPAAHVLEVLGHRPDERDTDAWQG